MCSVYYDQAELEDDLYQEDEGDCEGSEVDSELEFHLYSQLHYSSNPGEMEALEDGEEPDERRNQDSLQQEDKTTDGDSAPEDTSTPPSPITGSLKRGPKEEKKKQVEKRKTRKSDRRSQTLSSSRFEEVIVIDSSPEVISISEDDTTDDENGVCASKGQRLGLLQTSTPAQQETKRRKSSPDVPFTLVSSSSESDSEESDSSFQSESSDSDDLESWMILGGGRQDGDQSISLNVEGDSVSHAGSVGEEGWLVSEKDKEAQIFNKDKGVRVTAQRFTSRYYTGKNVQCRNCNKTGHLSKNCPDPKASPCFLCGTIGHLSVECPNKHCNNCGQPGHLYQSCSERAYWHKQCHRCSMTGHFFDACPEVWRQYHVSTKNGPPVKKTGTDNGRYPAYCYNCSQKGHFGHECMRQRMFKGVYPSIPFICHYDNMEDIKCRLHRTKLKAKGMRENGYLSGPSQTPLTPGPLKKKQKVSHYKNNHQPNDGHQRTPKNPKSNPSHIFFHDKFMDSTPKTKKLKERESGGHVKAWKPKRPVPTSRGPLPKAKLVLDESDDLPRGGGPEENAERRKGKGRNRKKMKGPPLSMPDRQRDTRPEQLFRTGKKPRPTPKQPKVEKKRKWKNRADKQLGEQMYPDDEDLFTIKQRKRRR
ncbi:zinc finger CCHC domain-containing protein 7 isoform 2-T2 [Menidia menidia]